MTNWFARPVLHVNDVARSLSFYVDRLGFVIAWQYEHNGRVHVAQVDGLGCALILAATWPEKVGNGLIFISVDADPQDQVTTLDAFRAELEAKSLPVKEGSWGYRVLVLEDPDGNQLFFNYPKNTTSDERDTS